MKANQPSIVSFSKGKRITIVYRNMVPCIALTRIYDKIRRKEKEDVAEQSIRELIHVDHICQAVGATWQGPVNGVREAVEARLQTRYGAVVHNRKASVLVIHAEPATIQTALSHLQRAYAVAEDLGLYAGNPLRGPGSPYFRVDRTVRIPPDNVLDNEALPDELRALAAQVHWRSIELAILEILIATGARISEVTDLTWAGMAHFQSRGEIRMRSKRSGGALVKTGLLSVRAVDALTTYLTDARPALDPWTPSSRRGIWTPDRHIADLLRRGEDPAAHPLFLTQHRTPYSADTFRKSWQKLQNAPGAARRRIVRVPHHIRHWFINRALAEIARQHGSQEHRHVMAILDFIHQMGWGAWISLTPYDHRRTSMHVLHAYHARQQPRGAVVHPDVTATITAGVGMSVQGAS